MGIDARHAYRFGYLKSEQWQTVRIQALTREGGRCQICGEFSLSNDAHHITYPAQIYDTSASDLVVLCRSCHNLTHAILDVHKLKSHTPDQFNGLCKLFRKWKSDKQGWISSPTKTSMEEGFCRACKKQSSPILYQEMFGDEQFKTTICQACSDDWNQLMVSLGDSDFVKYHVYKNWKKTRRESFH